MSDMYRDPEAGAVARRRDLLGRRRDELVTIPHAVRRVVVARRGRIAASIAAWIGAEIMVIAAVAPPVADLIARALPGREPAPLSTLLVGAWGLALLGYFIARSAAEHRFAVAMSRTVMPSDDLFHDLARLDQVHPDEVARTMAHRLEVRSAALPVVAAATLLPATAVYIAMGVARGGWPSERAYEAWIVGHATALAWLGMLGLAASAAMTRRAARLPIAAPIAAVATAAFASLAIVAWWAVGPAVIAATIAVIARRLRGERARIDAEDPAAGSEVFTLRGMFRQVRAAFGTCRAFVRWHRRAFRIGAVVAAAIATVWIVASTVVIGRSGEPADTPVVAATAPELAKVTPAANPRSHSTYRIDPASCDGTPCLRVTLVFHDHEAIDVPAVLPALTAIPPGWRARLRARFEQDRSTGRGATVIAFPVGRAEFDQNPRYLDELHPHGTFETAACATQAVPASLRVKPDLAGPDDQEVTLLLEPTLELAASCTP